MDSLSRAVAGVSVADDPEPQASGSGLQSAPSSSKSVPVKKPVCEIAGHKIRKSIYGRLYGYQIEGLSFLLKLFDGKQKGCILADDMGLGKTIQTIVLLSTLMLENQIKSVLIVAPTTLLVNWGKEFQVTTPFPRPP